MENAYTIVQNATTLDEDAAFNRPLINKYQIFMRAMNFRLSYLLTCLISVNDINSFIRRSWTLTRNIEILAKEMHYLIQYLERFLGKELCDWEISHFMENSMRVKWRDNAPFYIPLDSYYPSLDFWGFNFEECINLENAERLNIMRFGSQLTEFRSALLCLQSNEIYEQIYGLEHITVRWCWGSTRPNHQRLIRLVKVCGGLGYFRVLVEENHLGDESFTELKEKILQIYRDTAQFSAALQFQPDEEDMTETENLSEASIAEESFFFAPELMQDLRRRNPFLVYQDLSRLERERRRIKNPPFLIRKD